MRYVQKKRYDFAFVEAPWFGGCYWKAYISLYFRLLGHFSSLLVFKLQRGSLLTLFFLSSWSLLGLFLASSYPRPCFELIVSGLLRSSQ